MFSSNKLISFVAISAALLVAVRGHDGDGSLVSCPSGFVQLEDTTKCVQIVKSMLNWYQADRTCRSMGANLMTVRSERELKAYNTWIPQAMPYQLELWTSGNDLGQNGTYYWQSTGEKITYLPWATGPVANILSGGNCLTLYGNFTRPQLNAPIVGYKLINEECEFISMFICELPQQKTEKRICLKSGAFEMMQVAV